MDFESVEQTARRLQVTTRSVQKWAKDGKIPGASRMGRTWLIPVSFAGPEAAGEEAAAARLSETMEAVSDEHGAKSFVSLFDADFEPGKCLECIESISGGVAQRDVAMAQFYFLRGQAKLAVAAAEPYLDHEDPMLALTASVVYCFANIGLGKVHMSQIGQDYIKKHVTISLRVSDDPRLRAYAVFIATMSHVLLHASVPPLPPLENVVKYLPQGVKLMAAYVMAHEAYLQKEYNRSLGIADMALAFCEESYVIPQIYLHLIICVDLMNLRRTVEAKNCLERAWQLARPDDLLEIFGEHIGLLQGLLEVCLKKRYPEDYERILCIADVFGDSWRKIHNAKTNRTVADSLTATEWAIATLFQRGWTVKEISAYMEMSHRMIRHHISVIYEKLGITHREELAQYMML